MSKYDTLEQYLKNSQKHIEILSYDEIEKILGLKLPPSAYNHRPWWANGGHSQANSWINAGWQVSSVSLGKSIAFRKTGKKELTDEDKSKSSKTEAVLAEGKLKNKILVDGSNVALASKKDGKPKIDNIERIRLELEKRDYDPIVFVDASLRHRLPESDKKRFEKWIDEDKVIQSPAGVRADNPLLEYADKHKLKIVSNDTFKEYKIKYPWLEDLDRVMPFNIIRDDAIILSRKKKAAQYGISQD